MLRTLSTLISRNHSCVNINFSRTLVSMKAKKWVLVRNFQGEPKDGDAAIEEETLPELADGDILLESHWWSVDPYMRPRSNTMKPGSTMPGECFAKVVESRNTKYPIGTGLVVGLGWRTHSVCNPDKLKHGRYFAEKVHPIRAVPHTGILSKSVNLGVLGVPGLTAYFGFLELCQPQPGETVLVNGAAGAVGSLVGQIAKIKGCKVIGFAGTDEKVKYLKDLGFDYGYNYRTTDVSTALAEAAPKGVDCYFDNVGGDFSTRVITQHMRDYGRISCCGSISRYNDDMTNLPLAPEIYQALLFRQLRMEGFIVFRWFDRFPEAQTALLQWISEGKLKYREHISHGFENVYPAFQGLLKGDNTGKAVIKSTDVTTIQSKL